MSVNPLLLPIKKDVLTIKKTVLTNLVKMIYNRKWISDLDKNINRLLNKINDEDIYEIDLDISLKELKTYDPFETNHNEKFNDKKIIIKIYDQHINSISKSQVISDFLFDYQNYHKILIVKGYSDKIRQTLMKSKYIEIFSEPFLMVNLLEISGSPQYEILTQEEANLVLNEYLAKLTELGKMNDTDPASQYLFLKRKQVVRIIRNSEITGKSVYYRVVVRESG